MMNWSGPFIKSNQPTSPQSGSERRWATLDCSGVTVVNKKAVLYFDRHGFDSTEHCDSSENSNLEFSSESFPALQASVGV